MLAPLIQGVASTALLIASNSFHPFIFFMLLCHIILPVVFWNWTELIHGAHR